MPGQQDPNLQDRKNDFIGRDGASDANYLQHSVSEPRSPYEVKAGTIIPTTLLTGLNSDLPGEVVGQVRESVYDTVTGNYLIIPQGSRLLAKSTPWSRSVKSACSYDGTGSSVPTGPV
jgi:type IV secretion system protein TrbI